MGHRFKWTPDRDAMLRARWLSADPQALAASIGCRRAAFYQRAKDLELPPRDPVQRAVAQGAPPAPRISLPRVAFLERAFELDGAQP